MKRINLLIYYASFALLSSCAKEHAPQPPALGYNYFPTNVGHQLIYDVRTIFRQPLDSFLIDSSFQILETVQSIYYDNQGRPTERLERYARKTSNDTWVIYKVWISNLTATQALKEEDNNTYVKLVFPVQINRTWNGNVYNSLPEEDYTYSIVNSPDAINGFNFDSSLTVIQRNEQNFIYSY